VVGESYDGTGADRQSPSTIPTQVKLEVDTETANSSAMQFTFSLGIVWSPPMTDFSSTKLNPALIIGLREDACSYMVTVIDPSRSRKES
jgi:hypothetical protein